MHESISKTIQRLRQSRKPVVLCEDDIEEHFVRSSGPGGQNANMRSTAVRLLHKPTGINVRAEGTRHQEMNRREARQLLKDALDETINGICSLSNLRVLEKRGKKVKKQVKCRKKYRELEAFGRPDQG